MTTGWIIAISIGSSLSYFIMVGIVMKWLAIKYNVSPSDEPGPIFGGVFWPLSFPALLGLVIVEKLHKRKLNKPPKIKLSKMSCPECRKEWNNRPNG